MSTLGTDAFCRTMNQQWDHGFICGKRCLSRHGDGQAGGTDTFFPKAEKRRQSLRDGRQSLRHECQSLSVGYILVETLVALTVLSLSAMGLQRAISQATLTRGLAQDYTTVQLLAENMLSNLMLQNYMLVEMQDSGTFPPPNERFAYTLEVGKVDVPRPELPSRIPLAERQALEKRYNGWMPKVRLEITWTRAGAEQSRVFETLYGPERLWQPPPPEGGGGR